MTVSLILARLVGQCLTKKSLNCFCERLGFDVMTIVGDPFTPHAPETFCRVEVAHMVTGSVA